MPPAESVEPSSQSGTLFLGSPEWLWPVAIAGLLLIGMTFYNYSASNRMGPFRWLAAVLKSLAIALFGLCLLQPMQSESRPVPQANIVPILVDDSQSMQLKANRDSLSRGEQVSNLLFLNNSWRTRLEQDFDVRSYRFSDRIESTRLDDSSAAGMLTLKGSRSSLKSSLLALSERFTGRPVGGIILMSDGNLTDPPESGFDWSSLGFPVYPVVTDELEEVEDVRIEDVSIRQTDFESAPITAIIKVDTGSKEKDVVVQLRDAETKKVVGEQAIASEEAVSEATFRFRPEQSGLRFYEAVVFSEVDRGEFKEGVPHENSTGEATLANNARLIAIDRKAGPYRILYISGRPNWEFKFLRRALAADAEIQLVGLIRIANKEPKFSFRDQGVSSTNPLFEGLDKEDTEIAQQYDEPVMIRMGVRQSEELSNGFPESPEELFAYHAVILDDIESEFFSGDQLLLLRQFVSARGGGLLLLGGQESFAAKGFSESPLGELAPVYAPKSDQITPPGEYRMTLTREGMLQPWVRLRDNESAEKDRLSKMAAMTTVNAVGDVKPGAFTLATVTEGNEVIPAIVAQRFGKGRTAAIPIGDLWRWSMHRDSKSDGDHDDPAQAWRQLSHWLVGEVPRRVEARIQSPSDPNEPTQIVVTARDEVYLPIDNATVDLEITPVAGEPFTMVALPDDSAQGVYRASHWARGSGAFRVVARVKAADGSLVGESETGWVANTDAAEFKQLTCDHKLLQAIASATGGEVIPSDELDSFVSDLPRRKLPVTEPTNHPLWHNHWLMLFAMGCLCGEWGLRRWKGMA